MTTDIDVQAVIDEMVRRLVERFDPLQVVLFGSHARGEAGPDSDVDLLLVLAEVEHKRKTVVEALNLLADMPVPKDVLVRTPEEIWRECRVPGSVVRNALSEGRVVYERDERPGAAREWLALARGDLEAGEMLRAGGAVPWSIAFHAQQSAEKALKAALILAGVDFPRTHDLDELLGLVPEGWAGKGDLGRLDWLSKWAVDARCAGIAPTREEAAAALDTARMIREGVVRDLRAHGLDIEDADAR
jgi:HEPN domain-containing protein/predicted nucleotidyltransferase